MNKKGVGLVIYMNNKRILSGETFFYLSITRLDTLNYID